MSEWILYLALLSYAIGFIVYPMLIIVIESFRDPLNGSLSLNNYYKFFTDRYYFDCLINSVITALLTVLIATVLGLPLAYILARYKLVGKTIYTALSLLPILLPPYVGVFAFIILFGKMGVINLLLIQNNVIKEPINFLDGLHGVVFVETVHLLPFIVISCSAGLTQIDPSFEEAAEVSGATGLYRFFSVSLPLITPQYVSGAFLVFSYVLGDWLTPLILGQRNYLATIAFINIAYHFVDIERKYMGIIASVLASTVSVIALLLSRYYVERKKYSVLSKGTTAEGRVIHVHGLKKFAAYVYVGIIMVLVLLSPAVITLAAFSRRWVLTPFPEHFTFENIRMLFIELPSYIQNTIVFSSIATLLALPIALGTSYVLARTNLPGKNILDGILASILVIPGIMVGVGYLIGFDYPVPLLDVSLSRVWFIMPLVLCARRLPYLARNVHASFLQLEKSLEEAAQTVGASRLRTFFDISLPLIMRGVFAGIILFFVMAIQEISSTIFLYRPGWETLPIGIYLQWNRGTEFGVPAAAAFVLVIITLILLLILSKLGQRVLGGAFAI
ncbi:iron ABC transporter permease [Thermofilum sp.]|uniref:ABC transporter permease n=1 Tax=Thermofilum sp. TaxID=1961369 RepID=UPI003163AFEB